MMIVVVGVGKGEGEIVVNVKVKDSDDDGRCSRKYSVSLLDEEVLVCLLRSGLFVYRRVSEYKYGCIVMDE